MSRTIFPTQQNAPLALWSKATNFVDIAMPRGRLARRAALYQVQKDNSSPEKLFGGMERSDKRNVARPVAAERLASGSSKSSKRGMHYSGVTKTNEKAVRQQDGLLFQGRIVPTEFEKDHQNFLAKSYWPEKGSVKGFLDNKCLCFQ